ncbi:Calcium/calmodulin-dependent protein kinase type II delta chain [Porphyridium purpureum]|uniref:Calcium/calmodulin-dependent protein kinase type II delta chain n=1 Tax=Porphyridium purpureum TaxID=35688 RepID=A0A5J4Z5U7_PORPP|nr:Calcium/calmodulin-dependent protein kinase type II delta chain [Porphyridium purpureum]|eukprot:POR5373..scf295_1
MRYTELQVFPDSAHVAVTAFVRSATSGITGAKKEVGLLGRISMKSLGIGSRESSKHSMKGSMSSKRLSGEEKQQLERQRSSQGPSMASGAHAGEIPAGLPSDLPERYMVINMPEGTLAMFKSVVARKASWETKLTKVTVTSCHKETRTIALSVDDQETLELVLGSHELWWKWCMVLKQATVLARQLEALKGAPAEEEEVDIVQEVLDAEEALENGPKGEWLSNNPGQEPVPLGEQKASLMLKLELFYDIHEEIGEGTFGKVFRGSDAFLGEDVAIKHMKCKGGEEEYLRQEMQIIRDLPAHPNVLTPYDIFKVSMSEYYVVMELMPHGDLFDVLEGEEKVTEGRAAYIIKCVLAAVGHLHKHRVLHRDLKVDNIFLKYTTKEHKWPPLIKVGDFSFAAKLAKGVDMVSEQSFVGTLLYLAPESIKHKDYGYPVDMWAVGIILFMLMSGKFPFWGEDDKDYLRAVVQEPLEFAAGDWDTASHELKQLVSKLLLKNPADRIRLEDARRSAWFSIAMSEEPTSVVLAPPTMEDAPVKGAAPSTATAAVTAAANKSKPPKNKAQRAKPMSRMRRSFERFIPGGEAVEKAT